MINIIRKKAGVVMTFYEKFVDECNKKHIRPSKAALEIGVAKNTYYSWKNRGVAPKRIMIDKIAEYFGVDSSAFYDARLETILEKHLGTKLEF